jgi:hypothetical protein
MPSQAHCISLSAPEEQGLIGQQISFVSTISFQPDSFFANALFEQPITVILSFLIPLFFFLHSGAFCQSRF